VRTTVIGRLESLAEHLVQVQADLAVGHTLDSLVKVYSYLHHKGEKVGVHVTKLFLHLVGTGEEL
jgi:hypothetical protein